MPEEEYLEALSEAMSFAAVWKNCPADKRVCLFYTIERHIETMIKIHGKLGEYFRENYPDGVDLNLGDFQAKLLANFKEAD